MPIAEIHPDRSGALERDGHSIHYEYFGGGDREAVCLLNGLAMHTKAWYGFLPRLRPEFDVLLYDYPGQGASSSHDVPYSIPAIASYLDAILSTLRIERVHIMGVSYGGFIALDFARLFPGRLYTLALSGIFLSHERLFDMYEALSLRFYRGGPELFDLYTQYMYEKIFGEAFVASSSALLEEMRRRFCERYRDRTHSLIRLTEAQDPFFAALDANMMGYRAIAAPTLVIPGAEDRVMLVAVQRKLMDVLPNARWCPIERSGHVVYLEQPDAFWGALTTFMRERA